LSNARWRDLPGMLNGNSIAVAGRMPTHEEFLERYCVAMR
jgi:hypothetical protein